MGRQISTVTAWTDEQQLLDVIAADSELRIFRSIADSPEELWISDWQTKPIREVQYHIWPTQFAWTPQLKQITPPCADEVCGKCYISNAWVGPVIQFTRHLHGDNSPGRLYWSKDFVATEPLSYDVAAFDKLVSRVWRWVRKNGQRTADDAWVLPGARSA